MASHLTCHLANGLITDPVCTVEGDALEWTDIEAWLASGCTLSPLAGSHANQEVTPNQALKHVVSSILATELKDVGYTTRELSEAGFTAAELQEAGFAIPESKAVGSTVLELRDAGFTLAELKDAGFTATVLKEYGFTSMELGEVGFTDTGLE